MSANIRFLLLIAVQLIILGSLFFLQSKPQDSNAQKQAEHMRSTANKLHAAGLLEEAATKYESYLYLYEGEDDKKAKVAYSIGELFEQSGELARALSFYYQVESFDSNSTYVSEARKRIVAVLEIMGKHKASRLALEQESSLGKKAHPKGAKVIAEISGESVYNYEVDAAFDLLPKEIREEIDKNKQRDQFEKSYVAKRAIYKRALRMKLDEKSDLKRHLATIKREMVVQKYFEKKMGKVRDPKSEGFQKRYTELLMDALKTEDVSFK